MNTIYSLHLCLMLIESNEFCVVLVCLVQTPTGNINHEKNQSETKPKATYDLMLNQHQVATAKFGHHIKSQNHRSVNISHISFDEQCREIHNNTEKREN